MATKAQQYLAQAELALIEGKDEHAKLLLKFYKALRREKDEPPSLVVPRPKNKPSV